MMQPGFGLEFGSFWGHNLSVCLGSQCENKQSLESLKGCEFWAEIHSNKTSPNRLVTSSNSLSTSFLPESFPLLTYMQMFLLFIFF